MAPNVLGVLAACCSACVAGLHKLAGPQRLALLVDGGTASASEDMVVWLRESRAATILGERTYGAGCGYVRGGAPARLDRIGWTVLMPNCARYTSDGINEVEGIDPDVALDLHEGSTSERIDRLVRALPR